MALTPEQQEQIEFQDMMQAGQRQHDIEMEKRRSRLETVRLAKEVLIENARSKPVDSREVLAGDITAFAAALEAHINS